MADIRIPYLVPRTSKAGVTSWYWQPSAALAAAGWKPVALGKDRAAAMHAAEARNLEVEAWKGGGDPATARAIKPRPQSGTFAALLDRYERDELNGRHPPRRGEEFGRDKIAASTRKTYRTSLKRLRLWAGAQPLAFVTPARVRALRDAMLRDPEQGGIGHHAAHQTLKMGRTVFAFAESIDLIPKGSNPFAKFGLAAPPPRDVIWSPPAREALILGAYEFGMPSLALAIMLGFAIGQREGDLLALTHKSFQRLTEHAVQPEDFATLAALAPDGVPMAVRLRQQKTKAWVEVPVTGNVRWAIESNIAAARASGSLLLLLDDTRGPQLYAGEAGQTRFQRDFAEVREWAAMVAAADDDAELAEELATLHFSDLRRTCVVYLGELGLDAHLIAAITGHDIDETQRILKTYMPRTTGRAARAIAISAARDAKRGEQGAKERQA